MEAAPTQMFVASCAMKLQTTHELDDNTLQTHNIWDCGSQDCEPDISRLAELNQFTILGQSTNWLTQDE